MKKLLLHVCCAPCSTYSIKVFQEKGFQITGFFFNPNIHPYKEFEKRAKTVECYFASLNLPLILEEDYLLEEFLKTAPFKKPTRCLTCYSWRLKRTAEAAQQEKFKYFSTTLLISPYQDHEALRQIGEKIQKESGVKFIYEDLRVGFKESFTLSRKSNLYRQNYCGCIFSEKERFYKEKKRGNKKKNG